MGRYIKQPNLRSAAMSPRRVLLIGLIFGFFMFCMVYNEFSRAPATKYYHPPKGGAVPYQHYEQTSQFDSPGEAIAPKLGNATARAELGNAAWKVLHTTLARFPEKPTADQSAALRQYIHLFQRLYPCGDCAEHFGEILTQFPPQVSSRNAAAGWGCHVHNEVNKKLKKELFDCTKIGDFYDCGCAKDEEEERKEKEQKKKKADKAAKKEKEKPQKKKGEKKDKDMEKVKIAKMVGESSYDP